MRSGFIRALSELNRADGHTCEVNPNRVCEHVKECPAAAPPLVEGNTPGSHMEGEKLDQVSYLYPGVLRQTVVSR